MKNSSRKIYLFPITMLGITAISGSIAMMTNVSADDLPSIDDNITITVDSACTMGQTVTSSHTTELNPGETNNTIGQSRIAAYCNDNEGYAIYAIGYTNSEYGNTNLVSTDGNHTIPTGTSGSNSYWNMKLTQGTATGPTSYLPTMVNEFTTNATIPNDYTKVAYRDSSTISQNQDPTETGSYFTTTYSAHIDTTQPAGIYNGQVQYVMVHPSSAPAPEIPPIYMQDTATIKSKLAKVGDTMQAVDSRDGKKYWITKLADGNIWMTQNLDLDIEAGRTYTSEDTDLTYSNIGTTWTPTSSTSITIISDSSKTVPSSYDPGNLYWDGDVTWDSGKISNRTVADPSATPGGTHYHIGNYYNWTAAVAMNNSSRAYGGDANQSICPAGWMLPKSGNTLTGSGSFVYLVNQAGLEAGTSGNIQNAPTYFVYGGHCYRDSYGVGSSGNYWPSVARNSNDAYYLNFSAAGSITPQYYTGRGNIYSIRCIAR